MGEGGLTFQIPDHLVRRGFFFFFIYLAVLFLSVVLDLLPNYPELEGDDL